jgi:hypothetical protein
MHNDLINGLFECIGGLLVWINVARIVKDKRVHGISCWVQAFFTAWGFWNLYYYPSLNQWCSFWGGAVMSIGNTAWVVLAMKYSLANRRSDGLK